MMRMRKIKFIYAIVIILVIASGVLVFVGRNCYSTKAVLTEVCRESAYVDQLVACPKTPMPSKPVHPWALEKVIGWYKYNFSTYNYKQIKPIDPNEPILVFYQSGSLVVKLTFKMSQVSSVEIRNMTGSSQSALKLKSRLEGAFPNLPCTIVTPP